MKKHNILNKTLLLVAVALLSFTSCQQEIVHIDELKADSMTNKKSVAAPSISGVYAHNDFYTNESPTLLTKVELNSEIVIAGQNLQGLSAVMFNNQTLNLNNLYQQWDKVVLRLPDSLPSTINDTLKLANSFGTAAVKLGLLLPDAVFEKVGNGFQFPGRTTTIHGANFSLYGFDTSRSSVRLEDEKGYNKQLEVLNVTDKELLVKIPDDAPDNAYFAFTTAGENQPQRLHYRPTDKLLFSGLNPVNTLNNVPDGFTYTDGSGKGDPENLIPYPVIEGGEVPKFYRQAADTKAWATFLQIKHDIAFEIPDGKTAADYYLVYEINTAVGKPIPTGNSYILFISGTKSESMWEDFGQVVIDTRGEWVTQRIELADVKFKYGTFVEAFIIKPSANLTKVDHSFANFRIEPKMP